MYLLFFSIFSQKGVLGSQLHRVCVEQIGTSAYAVFAIFRHFFCYVCVFGDLSHSVVPILRGATEYDVTVCAQGDTGSNYKAMASHVAPARPS